MECHELSHVSAKHFGIDDGAGLKFGPHKELIIIDILKYKYCVNKSRYTSRDQFG